MLGRSRSVIRASTAAKATASVHVARVLRVISDSAGEDLPMDFNRFARPDGSLSLGRLLLGLARSPRTVPGLIRFRSRLRQASSRLARALDCLLSADDLFRSRGG